MQELNKEPKLFSFTLSWIQRVMNPPERLIYALCGYGIISIGSMAIFIEFYSGLIIVALVWLAAIVVFRNAMISIFNSTFGKKYINVVQIESGGIQFGMNELQFVIPLHKGTTISQGLFGTYIIRLPLTGQSLTLPKSSANLEELNKMLELNTV